MNELKQALRQAVEALTEVTCYDWAHDPVSVDGNDSAAAMCDAAITAAEAALAQPEQEPVAWQHKHPVCDASGILIGYGAWEEGRGLGHWPTRALYASVPAQSAELVAIVAERDDLRERLAASEASDAESIRMYRAARDERDRLHASIDRWVIAAAPGGWVHELAAERDEARRTVKMAHEAGAQMAAECARLRAAITEECMLTECVSPEGDPRDVLKRLTVWHAETGAALLRAEVARLQSALDDAQPPR